MTTVTAVKRALEETASENIGMAKLACRELSQDATALTILANRLSDRGRAGNDAARVNLKLLSDHHAYMAIFAASAKTQHEALSITPTLAALEWAIDQLTPPELST